MLYSNECHSEGERGQIGYPRIDVHCGAQKVQVYHVFYFKKLLLSDVGRQNGNTSSTGSALKALSIPDQKHIRLQSCLSQMFVLTDI